jgi:hypothetical protein
MKYLIVKGGFCGFGDRLECLKMAVKYALKWQLQIYVDWEDPIWSHSGENFYTYFKLVNMPVLKSIDDIPADATVFPAFWKDKLKLQYIEDYSKTNPEINLGYIQDQVWSEDVIVHSSENKRYIYPDSGFFANVFRVIDQRIITKVKERQQKYQLSKRIGVHLRGTDRAKKIDKSYRMSELNLRLVTSGIIRGATCIAVSDDPDFVNMWKSRYSSFPLLTESGALGGIGGVHTKSKDSLPISKDSLNVDMLVDFFTLASCRQVISTANDSRFAKEAQRLSKHINVIIS